MYDTDCTYPLPCTTSAEVSHDNRDARHHAPRNSSTRASDRSFALFSSTQRGVCRRKGSIHRCIPATIRQKSVHQAPQGILVDPDQILKILLHGIVPGKTLRWTVGRLPRTKSSGPNSGSSLSLFRMLQAPSKTSPESPDQPASSPFPENSRAAV